MRHWLSNKNIEQTEQTEQTKWLDLHEAIYLSKKLLKKLFKKGLFNYYLAQYYHRHTDSQMLYFFMCVCVCAFSSPLNIFSYILHNL